jgi:hypothetical protein
MQPNSFAHPASRSSRSIVASLDQGQREWIMMAKGSLTSWTPRLRHTPGTLPLNERIVTTR